MYQNQSWMLHVSETFARMYFIMANHLADTELHDGTKDTITVFCQLIQNYFKDVCIPYIAAILLKCSAKQLLYFYDVYCACIERESYVCIIRISHIGMQNFAVFLQICLQPQNLTK